MAPIVSAGLVYRIQQRHVVDRSPSAAEHAAAHRSAANLFGHAPTPFTLPTTHVWSLQKCDPADEGSTPHVVLFHDADNARCMVRALTSYSRREKRLPRVYEDLKDVFRSHFRDLEVPVRGGGSRGFGGKASSEDDLHVDACDYDAVSGWAAARRIGLLVFSKIKREEGGRGVRFIVPATFLSPADTDSAVEDGEVQREAFVQDFGWQLSDVDSDFDMDI